jgi:hypothetical protein
MSLAATTYVLHRRYGNQTRKLIMIAIADFADDSGKAWPSIDTLADRAECSRRSVQEHLQHLRAAGELVIIPNAGRSGTHLYRIIFKKNHGTTPHVEGDADPAPPVQMAAGNLHKGGANGRRSSAPEPSGTVIEPSNERAPLPPPGGGIALYDGELLAKINNLSPAWLESPALTRRESRIFRGNRAALMSIADRNWPIMAAYLKASIPEGAPRFQPRSREQFLDSPTDVLTHALQWHRKREGRQPPKPPAEIAKHDPLSRDEIRETLTLTNPASP